MITGGFGVTDGFVVTDAIYGVPTGLRFVPGGKYRRK